MTKTIWILALTCTVAVAAPKGPDLKAIAEKLAGDVAGVKEGETVAVAGDLLDAELVHAIFLAAGKRGAQPIMVLTPTLARRKWFDEVPAKYDANLETSRAKLADLIDVEFIVARDEAPQQLNGVAAERIEATRKAGQPVAEKLRKRKVRLIELGNGLFPTRVTARALGLTEAELASIFWAGVGTDYQKLSARGDAVKAALAGARELRVTSKAGTDLTFKPGPRPVVVSDGVISTEEAKAGGAGCFTWLPAGEAYGLIEPNTAEGKVVVPRYPYRGEDIKELTVTIKGGKVAALSARPSKAFDTFKAEYDATGPGKELFTLYDLGLNADVKAPKGKTLQSFVSEGAVTIFIGADTWAGGTNDLNWGIALMLTDATFTADAKPIVAAGVLKVAAN